MDRTEQDGIVHLEGTFKDHLVQLLDHFRANQKLMHIRKEIIQMPLEH